MDAKFHPAIAAIASGDMETFRKLVADDPSLATKGSVKSHPTLLQCVALDGKNGPLSAADGIDNKPVAELLLDYGAAIDGTGGWSPLEEALYWDSRNVIALLLERGAKVRNLRVATGLGRTDLIEGYFNRDGTLKQEAGKIDWPFGDLDSIAASSISGPARLPMACAAQV